jgi:uncharacterized protein
MPLLSIPAQGIDTAGLKVDVDLPADWLGRELADTEVESTKPGHLNVRLSRSGTDVVVRGEATATVTMPCARCLGPANVDLRGELSLLLKAMPGAHEAHGRGGAGHGGAGGREHTGAGERAGAPAGDMWARAAARSIPEWGATARGAKDASGGASPVRGARGAGGSAKAASGKGGAQARKAKEPEHEFSSEDAEFDTYDGETVVLDDFIREALVLELPNFPLCSEACPGIRPVESATEAGSAEASDRVDPRLAPLGALRAKLASVMNGRGPEPAIKPASRGAEPKKTSSKSSKSTKTTKDTKSTSGAGGAGKPKKKTTKRNKE